MIRIFHVSDTHFGAEHSGALKWFHRCARDEQPDAVIVTGDLTMGARPREFASAEAWLTSLNRPVTVEVGNHDLPALDLFQRFVNPYRQFRALKAMIEKPLKLPGLAIIPLKTTARFQWRLDWSKGHISADALAHSLSLIEAVPQGAMVLVAAHHPLTDTGTETRAATRNGADALSALAKAGARAVLTGHVHDPFDLDYKVEGNTIRLIGAGTLSKRLRAAPPSFNDIQILDNRINVIAREFAAPDEMVSHG